MQYEERTRIATPEGVELELVLAGLASRFIAEAIDRAADRCCSSASLVAVAALAGGAAGLVIAIVALGGAAPDRASPTTSPSRCSPPAAPPASGRTGCAS